MTNCGLHERLKSLEFVEYSEQGKSYFKNKKNKDTEVFWMDLRSGQKCPMCGEKL